MTGSSVTEGTVPELKRCSAGPGSTDVRVAGGSSYCLNVSQLATVVLLKGSFVYAP